MSVIPKPKSKFLKIRCKKCKNEQIIFNKPATLVRCLVCETILATPRGGKAKIPHEIREEYD